MADPDETRDADDRSPGVDRRRAALVTGAVLILLLGTLAARWQRLDLTVLLAESRLGVFVEGLGDPVAPFGEMGFASADSVPVGSETYSNESFRAVRVRRLAAHTFHVRGEARVFEATVRYAVEDGHYRLASGYTNASVGAPEWGRFEFVVSYAPEPHGTQTRPTLVLYEESMRTGAPTHELIVPLDRVAR